MKSLSEDYKLNRREQIFYFVVALFLNITLVTDLLRGINNAWFGFPIGVIENIKVIIYIIIFIYILVIIITKPIPKAFLVVLLVLFLVLCSSIIATPSILVILLTFILLFFSRCIPGFYIGYSINNFKYLFDALRLYIWIALVYSLFMVTGLRNAEGLYFTFGYNLLLPALVALISGVVYKKYYLILGIFLTICIIGFGGRGALICLFASLLLLFYLFSRSIKLLSKVVLYATSICCLFIVLFYYDSILHNLLQLFPDSRTLVLILNGNFWGEAGRYSFYNESFRLINESPLSFRGILSDRILLSTAFNNIEGAFGSYAHNILLEIFIQFGVLVGGILIVFLLLLFINSLLVVIRSKDIYLKVIYSILIGYNIQLLFSGSYISSPMFWMALGLIVSMNQKVKFKIS